MGEAVGDPLCLLLAELRERRVALSVDEWERPVLAGRRGLAVPDQQDLGGARWEGESVLSVLRWVGHTLH